MIDQNNLEAVADNESNSQEQSLPSAGELLSQERERRGLTEKEVADDLHITMHYVRAIESDSYEKLPGSVFAKGYIKSYAMLLGLDIELVMASYNAHVTKEMDVEKEKTRIQVRKRKDKNRPWVIASAALFIALFIGLWLVNYSSTEPEPAAVVESEPSVAESAPGLISAVPSTQLSSPTPASITAEEEAASVDASPVIAPEPLDSVSVPATTTASTEDDSVEVSSPDFSEVEETVAVIDESPAPQIDIPVATAPSDSAAPAVTYSDQLIYVEADGDDVLMINFSGESWVEVSDDSQGQIYRDLLETGDVLEVKGTAPFNVLLGDAPFAELTLNGDAIDVSDDIRIDNSARFTIGMKQ